MYVSVLAALLLALLCSLHPLPLCEAAVYYVKPTQPHNVTCPSDHPCLTLDEYAVNSKRYFTSNRVFLFLSGHHTLNSSLKISGICNLTFKPYNDDFINDKGCSVSIASVSHVPVTVQFEAVSDVGVIKVTLWNIKLAFEESENIAIDRLSPGEILSPTNAKFSIFSNSYYVNVTLGTIVIVFKRTLNVTITQLSPAFSYTISHYRSSISSPVITKEHYTSSTSTDVSVRSHNDVGANFLCPIVLSGRSTMTLNGNMSFECDGAITMSDHSTIIIQGTVYFKGQPSPMIDGGAIATNDASRIVISGNVTFDKYSKGAIVLRDSSCLILNGTVTFSNNSKADIGGAVRLKRNSTIFIGGEVKFINNKAGLFGGAIGLTGQSRIIMRGNITFRESSARMGGAIALLGNRTIWLPKPDKTHITFSNNFAGKNGGALYFKATQYVMSQCSFYFPYVPNKVVLNFINNTAIEGGDAIYGAMLGAYCVMPTGEELLIAHIVLSISHFSPSFDTDPSVISSDGFAICFCHNYTCSHPLVYHNYPTRSVYPGEIFEVSAALVGDMGGLVSFAIRTSIASVSSPPGSAAKLDDSQYVQYSSRDCTNFKFSIFTNVTDYLCQLDLGIDTVISKLFLNMLSCPIGFALDSKTMFCDCEKVFCGIETISCNITERAIQRQAATWIGVLEQNTTGTNVVFSTACPLSYCSTTRVALTTNATHLDQDVQCNNNRSGILCGGCRLGYSLALGSNRCLPGCTNNTLVLIIGFVIAGIALVFFIKILDLTVSRGTSNGLIFYANIIGAQTNLFSQNLEVLHIEYCLTFFLCSYPG